jgi:hypothetical protein
MLIGQRDFFLNVLYTYLKFGDADFFIVGTTTQAAFEDCVLMELPCYNATEHYNWVGGRFGGVKLNEHGHEEHHNFGSLIHVQLTWMKASSMSSSERETLPPLPLSG